MNNLIILNNSLKQKASLMQRIEHIYSKVAKSFDISDLPKISVAFHTSRLSFDKSLGRKTFVWEVGNTSSEN